MSVRWPWKDCDCGERILFLRTRNSRWAPVDPDPRTHKFPDERSMFDPKKHQSHHTTCRLLSRFRRGEDLPGE